MAKEIGSQTYRELVKAKIAIIAAEKSNEKKHILEDELVEGYVRRMAELGDSEAEEVAKVYDIEYARWYS